MAEPRVSLLASESGVTFGATGVAVIRESLPFFDRVVSQPPTKSRRDFEVVITFQHETLHFVQAMTSAYLQNHSMELIHSAWSVLKHLDDLREVPSDKVPLFVKSARRLSFRDKTGLSGRDLLESVAVVESFKLADVEPSLSRFLAFREKYFAGGSESPYRRGFDWLAWRIGQELAYELLDICRKFCSGGAEGAAAPVGEGVKQPGSRTVRPQ